MSTPVAQTPASGTQPERIDTSVPGASTPAGDPRSPPLPSSPRPLLADTPIETLMIDNFDSFTWNLYQSLCILGAKVTVLRNNELTVDDFPNLRIRNLIISPGPGHPSTDSGISNEAIRYFAGRVPVLGVCMGLECMVETYGGTIEYAGEIMHGKTSPIRHDNRGCFRDLPQSIQSTRYHSLSAHRTTLPPALAITATTAESGVIMGVRHRELTLEAVQYHPESIMSEEGDALLRNFLDLQGGTWAENPVSRVLDPTLHPFSPEAPHRAPTILDKIYAQRLKDVELAKSTPGTTKEDLQTFLSMQLAPPLVPLVARLKARTPALMAEIKRASPSKGPIAMHTNAAQQALTYALAGASVISVLTEPSWFKGSLLDMRLAREAVATLTDRPAILRKDFIVDEYQICEARLWGADTVLLIVAMLPPDRLRALYLFSVSLGMEPLVEVNNAEEMATALRLGAKVIGVNNRNLHDFNVDMGTTSRLADMVAESDVILCALSGISARADVVTYVGQGVGAVLVGESLMRASDPAAFIRTLLDLPPPLTPRGGTKPLVKICGVRNTADAEAAANAGADFIGVVMVPKSKRHVDLATAKEISTFLRARRAASTIPERPLSVNGIAPTSGRSPHPPASNLTAVSWFSSHARSLPSARPLLVGVFQDQPLNFVIHACAAAGLDMVQLHGHEPVEWSRWIPVPVIRAFHLRAKDSSAPSQEVNGTHDHTKDVDASGPTGLEDIARPGFHRHILLDAIKPGATNKLSGGAGVPVDWDLARAVADAGEIGRGRLPIILAGGLDAANGREAVEKVSPWAVDVSGGVETEGVKDHGKIREFVKAAKVPASRTDLPCTTIKARHVSRVDHRWARVQTSYRVAKLSTKVAQDKHAWSPSSSVPLNTFLRNNIPTVVGTDGIVPWIRVQRLEGNDHSPEFAGLDISQGHHNTVVERGKGILEEYTKKIVEVRRNKKISTEEETNDTVQTKGPSRKELAAEATEKLKQLALESKLTSGKWLFYPPERHVDKVFARLARDLVNGELSKTQAFAAKASTSPVSTKTAGPYIVCLYMPDLYNEEAVAEVLRAASRSIGIRANSAKPDLYTLIGLSRNHPSGIKSTIWSPTDLVPDREINELTSQYWNELRERMADA